MLTNKQLIKELRKPGRVYMPVIVAGDVAHIAAEKADLIYYLQGGNDDDPAPWCFFGTYKDGRKLDIQGD